jgi:hypothetical protein
MLHICMLHRCNLQVRAFVAAELLPSWGFEVPTTLSTRYPSVPGTPEYPSPQRTRSLPGTPGEPSTLSTQYPRVPEQHTSSGVRSRSRRGRGLSCARTADRSFRSIRSTSGRTSVRSSA